MNQSLHQLPEIVGRGTGDTSWFHSQTPLWVQGDYLAPELGAMEDTSWDSTLESSVWKKSMHGKSLYSRFLTLLQQKATILSVIHLLGGRGGLSVLQFTDKETEVMKHSIWFPPKKLQHKKAPLPKSNLWNLFKMHLRMVTITFLSLLLVAAIRMK